MHQMYMIKLLEKDGVVNNIAENLGIHPFIYRKLSYNEKKYTTDELKNLILEFGEYDEKSKIGEMDMEKGLIRIIASM